MSLGLLTQRSAVLSAIEEYDRLGQEAFLEKYLFGEAKAYRLVHQGRIYDSKAIAGVAVGFEHPDRGPMTYKDFSGGMTVKIKLEQLGFQVESGPEVEAALSPSQAYELIELAWREPKSTKSKLWAWALPSGRELALSREAKTAMVWTENFPPDAGGTKTITYEPERKRTTSLKSSAPRLAQPYQSYYSEVASADALKELVRWYGNLSSEGLDPEQLNILKSSFLASMPGFGGFQNPGVRYVENERAYKDELVAKMAAHVLPLAVRALDDDNVAAELWDAVNAVLTGPLDASERKAQNLVYWRALDKLKPKTDQDKVIVGRACADLLVGDGDQFEKLGRFIQLLSVDFAAKGYSSTPDSVRTVGTLLLMCGFPDSSILIRWGVFDQAFQRLIRQRISTFSDDAVAPYREAIVLVSALREYMMKEWNWHPKDLIDVQSFLFVALEYSGTETHKFADAMEQFIDRFSAVSQGPMQKDEVLWDSADKIRSIIERLSGLEKREGACVDWSVGKGGWAKVPWFAIRPANQTIRDGLYSVFLISKDHERVYLSLAMGVDNLVSEAGRAAAETQMIARAAKMREELGDLEEAGFQLSNDISLGGDVSSRAQSYEAGTIAFVEFSSADIPDDARLEMLLGMLLDANERLILNERPLAATNVVGYSIDEALSDVFMSRVDFERIVDVWRTKKNLILQGAPGVGKSFIARRLAFALMDEKAENRLEAIQFHQSYGYEDFVQGYRPTEDGGFELRDGIFFRFCKLAAEDPEHDYAMLIDEINRGNLSKIFGELMLLMEHDKRDKDWATRLAYASPDDPKFWIPGNLHFIGLMNTADRSLSMVDYALRRRFAFKTLRPEFHSDKFREHLSSLGIPDKELNRIVGGMKELNSAIAADTGNLGPGYEVGHSYFVPGSRLSYYPGWLERIVETEIRPLLEEYWFDDPGKAEGWCRRLIGA